VPGPGVSSYDGVRVAALTIVVVTGSSRVSVPEYLENVCTGFDANMICKAYRVSTRMPPTVCLLELLDEPLEPILPDTF
jgi:hypothetical protein